MRSDLTVAEQNQSVVRLKAKNPNTLCSDRVRRRPLRLLASQSSRAISQPIRRCSTREWCESQRNQTGSSCCLEADAHDHFGDYGLTLTAQLSWRAAWFRIASNRTRSSLVQIQRDTQFGGTSIMATGASRRSASRRAREV